MDWWLSFPLKMLAGRGGSLLLGIVGSLLLCTMGGRFDKEHSKLKRVWGSCCISGSWRLDEMHRLMC